MKSFKEFLEVNEVENIKEAQKLPYSHPQATSNTTHLVVNKKTDKVMSPHNSLKDAQEGAFSHNVETGDDMKIIKYDPSQKKNESIDEDKKELHKELLKVKEQLDKVSSDIRYCDVGNHGGPVRAVQKREDLRDQHNELLRKLKSQHEAIEEGKMSEIHAGIMDIVDKPGVHNIKIGEPKLHTRTNATDGKKQFSVYPVTYHVRKKSESHFAKPSGPGFQTYVHHEVGTTDVKPGLPKRRGGDVLTVESIEK